MAFSAPRLSPHNNCCCFVLLELEIECELWVCNTRQGRDKPIVIQELNTDIGIEIDSGMEFQQRYTIRALEYSMKLWGTSSSFGSGNRVGFMSRFNCFAFYFSNLSISRSEKFCKYYFLCALWTVVEIRRCKKLFLCKFSPIESGKI